MAMSKQAQIDDALLPFRQIVCVLQKAGTGEWLDLDLSMAQLKALSALSEHAPITIGALGERLSIGLPAASSLIERLHQQGLVERREDPADRRRTFVQLSASGDELISRLRAGGQDRLRNAIARLDDEDLTALIRGLRALVAKLSEDGAPLSHGDCQTKATVGSRRS